MLSSHRSNKLSLTNCLINSAVDWAGVVSTTENSKLMPGHVVPETNAATLSHDKLKVFLARVGGMRVRSVRICGDSGPWPEGRPGAQNGPEPLVHGPPGRRGQLLCDSGEVCESKTATPTKNGRHWEAGPLLEPS